MPGNNAWNGRWSGEGRFYAVVRSVTAAKAQEIDGKSFGHNFGDGWYASVRVKKSSGSAETRSVRKKSLGFCGYDWMVNNILSHGSASDKQ